MLSIAIIVAGVLDPEITHAACKVQTLASVAGETRASSTVFRYHQSRARSCVHTTACEAIVHASCTTLMFVFVTGLDVAPAGCANSGHIQRALGLLGHPPTLLHRILASLYCARYDRMLGGLLWLIVIYVHSVLPD